MVILRSEHEELAFSLILNKIFEGGEITLLDTHEEVKIVRGAIESSPPSKEKQLWFILHEPLLSSEIEAFADLVITGVILGFVVQGAINLDGHIIYTPGGLGAGARGADQNRRYCNGCDEDEDGPSEENRYQTALDMGTEGYYYDSLRRDAFYRDARRRSWLAKAMKNTLHQ